jgi:hypothetical protein
LVRVTKTYVLASLLSTLSMESLMKMFLLSPCYVGPCHHGMARPQVVDGGNGLKMWRVTEYTLN